MARSFTEHLISGEAELTSRWFSNRWELRAGGQVLASLRRLGRIHVSTVTLPDGSRWTLEPAGLSTVRAVEDPDREFARITRRSWWGRRWEVAGPRFAYSLVSDPRPRRWRFEVGGSTIAVVSGSLVSYNTVHVAAQLALPLPALLLGWHVIARPWEAAAAPRGLVRAPRGPGEGPGPVS